MRAFIAAIIGLFFASTAQAQVCAVLGDSIASLATNGTPNQTWPVLVEASQQTSLRNLSAIGSTLGGTDNLGYNSDWTTDTMAHLRGVFGPTNCEIISAGRNDFDNAATIPISAVNASMVRILNDARASGMKVLVLDLVWGGARETAPASAWGQTFTQFREHRRALCITFFSDVCKFVYRPASLASGGANFGAGEHLTVAGHSVYATWASNSGEAWVW